MPTDADRREVPVVDLRGLDPPEPMVRILGALHGDGPLHFLLSREPFPLFAILRSEGWRWRTERRADGVELTLERRPTARTANRENPTR